LIRNLVVGTFSALALAFGSAPVAMNALAVTVSPVQTCTANSSAVATATQNLQNAINADPDPAGEVAETVPDPGLDAAITSAQSALDKAKSEATVKCEQDVHACTLTINNNNVAILHNDQEAVNKARAKLQQDQDAAARIDSDKLALQAALAQDSPPVETAAFEATEAPDAEDTAIAQAQSNLNNDTASANAVQTDQQTVDASIKLMAADTVNASNSVANIEVCVSHDPGQTGGTTGTTGGGTGAGSATTSGGTGAGMPNTGAE
jgi:hypothetical protein